jgi:hydrogenase expression/formation protein HypC
MTGWPGSRLNFKVDKPMCLAIPARVAEILENDLAIVELGGVRKKISLMLVDGVKVDDYVIVHVGFAINRLDPDEAEKTLALFAEIAAQLP